MLYRFSDGPPPVHPALPQVCTKALRPFRDYNKVQYKGITPDTPFCSTCILSTNAVYIP